MEKVKSNCLSQIAKSQIAKSIVFQDPLWQEQTGPKMPSATSGSDAGRRKGRMPWMLLHSSSWVRYRAG